MIRSRERIIIVPEDEEAIVRELDDARFLGDMPEDHLESLLDIEPITPFDELVCRAIKRASEIIIPNDNVRIIKKKEKIA